MIPPGASLGLLGGGQLGRMFAMAAQSMGYRVTVLDPGPDSPAGTVADRHLQGEYLDDDRLRELAATCAGATTEFENVPAESLRYLARHCVVSPAAESVAVAQDRIAEKTFLQDNGFPVAPFRVVRSLADFDAPEVVALVPGILKVSRFGYDGKGQARVRSVEEARAAWTALGGEPCVLEQWLPLARELSVVVARGFDGAVATFPVAENHHQHGILDVTIVPARVPDALAAQARGNAVALAERLDYRGVLCVEFFVLDDRRLLVNEIAPRPHNSGHYTIDACVTSQFEQQVRVLAGLPLGDTALHCPVVMVNILGEAWLHAGGEPDWSVVLGNPRAKLHLYGKREARAGRKMGHYTVLASSTGEALAQALHIREQLRPLAQPAQPIPSGPLD
jgi:5-(carboxyamino)imidazole ribonucleotide synthase